MRTQLNVRLPEHTIAQINELAAEMDESQAHVIIIAVDRLHVKNKGTEMKNSYPATIIETHDSWGDDSYYYNETRFDKEVAILKAELGDWLDIDGDDCNTYSFKKAVNGKAIYRLDGMRRDWFVIFELAEGGNSEGMFGFVADSFDNVRKAEEYLE